jgi:hypothetical protein
MGNNESIIIESSVLPSNIITDHVRKELKEYILLEFQTKHKNDHIIELQQLSINSNN